MGELLTFPSHREPEPAVVCAHLKLVFPTLYRIVQNVGIADVGAAALPTMALEDFVDYTIDPVERHVGQVRRRTVSHIIDKDYEHSIVIRHHPDLEGACAYLTALDDIGDAFDYTPVTMPDGNVFTLVFIRTMKSWPGPVVIYIADIPGENDTVDEWRHVVGPSGKMLPNLQTWADIKSST